ncbi:hypothetical protein GCM10011611_03120 [Aliidongia dinghuensis]|uniref:Uncharacterized protein n=1 Tax=Aliidongia dinghuensis TaxID=1867774 RepID=A0A8J2YPK0_9PROT|nr:hypothetical protein [Aliidongia dinghuensis]GGF00904.1 hypothetical protein GCM10011611_03120 [Aliidongia dinghuensis]
MTDPMDQIRRDYVAEEGIVSAILGEVLQLKRADGSTVAFKTGKAAAGIGVGHDVCVVAVRGEDKAVVVLDRTTGLRHRSQILRGNTGPGFQKIGKASAWFNFALMMVPLLGQLASIAGLLGAIVGALVERSRKGSPPVSIMTMIVGVAIYLLGSGMLYLHWIWNGSAFLGFVVMVVGAAIFCFLARRSGTAFVEAMERFLDEHQRPGAAKSA